MKNHNTYSKVKNSISKYFDSHDRVWVSELIATRQKKTSFIVTWP